MDITVAILALHITDLIVIADRTSLELRQPEKSKLVRIINGEQLRTILRKIKAGLNLLDDVARPPLVDIPASKITGIRNQLRAIVESLSLATLKIESHTAEILSIKSPLARLPFFRRLRHEDLMRLNLQILEYMRSIRVLLNMIEMKISPHFEGAFIQSQKTQGLEDRHQNKTTQQPPALSGIDFAMPSSGLAMLDSSIPDGLQRQEADFHAAEIQVSALYTEQSPTYIQGQARISIESAATINSTVTGTEICSHHSGSTIALSVWTMGS